MSNPRQPRQPKRLDFVSYSCAHEAIAHVWQVCSLAGLACSILSAGVLLIPSEGRPPVYVIPTQMVATLMWGLHFVCAEFEGGDYVEHILGKRNDPRF